MMSELVVTQAGIQFHWQTLFQLLVDIKKEPFNEVLFSCELYRDRWQTFVVQLMLELQIVDYYEL